MPRRKAKDKKSQWWYSRPVLLVLAILVVLVGAAALRMYDKRQFSANRLSEVQAELAERQERQAELEEELEYLSSERGVEAQIRSTFGYSKAGERVIILVDEDQEAPPPEEEESSFWQKLWPF